MTDHTNFSGFSSQDIEIRDLKKEVAELKLEVKILNRALVLQQSERAIDCIEYYIDNARIDHKEGKI